MRILLAGLVLLGAVAFLGNGFADDKKSDKKEVSLKGTITCGKCDLSVDDVCATVIVVKKDKKDIVYYFDEAGHKANHEAVCNNAKKGTVVGVISKDGKKNIVTVKNLKFD